MRYCNQCHRITQGEPIYCNFCGRSYDFRLCPSRHPNPRNAEICSQCGSRELSTPHPHVPLWLQFLIKILATLPGLLLVTVSVLFLFGVLHALLQNQRLMFQAVIAGLMLCFLWYLYSQLPGFLRRFISKLFTRSKRDDHGH
jgi:RNA polymerase subunit RPABC4/transcription elongation factor Spt4